MTIQFKDWDKAGKLFTVTLPNQLMHGADEILEKNVELYKGSILAMIGSGGEGWTPKTEGWANRVGDSLFIGETGQFYANLASNPERGLRAKKGDRKVFVGARYDVSHHSGMSMEDIAEILQATPDGSRQLFGPAYERVESQIMKNFKSIGAILK